MPFSIKNTEGWAKYCFTNFFQKTLKNIKTHLYFSNNWKENNAQKFSNATSRCLEEEQFLHPTNTKKNAKIGDQNAKNAHFSGICLTNYAINCKFLRFRLIWLFKKTQIAYTRLVYNNFGFEIWMPSTPKLGSTSIPEGEWKRESRIIQKGKRKQRAPSTTLFGTQILAKAYTGIQANTNFNI